MNHWMSILTTYLKTRFDYARDNGLDRCMENENLFRGYSSFQVVSLKIKKFFIQRTIDDIGDFCYLVIVVFKLLSNVYKLRIVVLGQLFIILSNYSTMQRPL